MPTAPWRWSARRPSSPHLAGRDRAEPRPAEQRESTTRRGGRTGASLGGGRAFRLGKAGLVVEVHALALHHQRPLLNLGVDGADVLSEDAHGNQLDRAEKENADYQRRYAD